MKTLYISDLDGTLLKKDRRISSFSAGVINNLINKGMMLSCATARSVASAKAIVSNLDLKMPLIVYNGTMIVRIDDGAVLYSRMFTDEERNTAKRLIMEYNAFPLVHAFVDGVERVSWIEGIENDGLRYYLECRKGDKRFRPVKTVEELYKGEVLYFTCLGDKEELMPLYKQASSYDCFNVVFQQELYRPEYWCELMSSRASKANAVLELKKICGCDKVVSFGDAINDLPMFMISDECYAVENAVSELKAAATGIIASNEDDGVAKWLLENAVY